MSILYISGSPYVNPLTQYKNGYEQCISDVSKILHSSSIDGEVTNKLMEHLKKNNIPASSAYPPLTSASSTYLPLTSTNAEWSSPLTPPISL